MQNNNSQISKGLSILIVLLISLIVSFLVSYFSYFYVFPEIEKKYLYIRTPDVRNLSASEAIEVLNKYGLFHDIIGEEEKEDVPPNVVILQYPLPKSLVKRNSIVSLIISKGVSLIKVPNLSSKSIEEAKKILSELGLVVGEIKEVGSEEIEKGYIITSEPQPGLEVKKGTKINILVSKGKPVVEKIQVPNLINKSLIEAKKILESKGLKLGYIKKVCDEDKEFDIIISQTPKAGSVVLKGSKVNVVLNVEEK